MPRDIEDLLRESLAARAQDVSPDPETFQRVQRRIRRGRISRRWAAGGVAVAALALAAVVVPNLRSQRVEFAPAPPVASQPAEEPIEEPATPTVAADAGGILFSAGGTLFSMALDGESAEPVAQVNPSSCPAEIECTVVGSLITDVASRAGSTLDALTGLIRTSEGCGRVGHISRQSSGPQSRQGVTYFSAGGCASAVGFAPDGRTGAVITDGGSEASGLSTFDWDDSVPDSRLTTFEIGLPAGRTRIEDWVWTTSDAAGDRGFLYLAADDVGDYYDDSRVYRLPVERQADGAVALPSDSPEQLLGDGGYHPWAYAEDDGAYTIDVHFSDDGKPDGARLARRVDDVATATFELPGELFAPSDDRDPWIAPDFWVDTLGNTIAYGDGDGAAWIVTWDGMSFTAPRRIEASVVTAELLAGPERVEQETPTDPTADEPSPAQEAQVDVEVHFATEGGACGDDVTGFPRVVAGRGVLRAALEQLLAGPTPEEIASGASAESGFGAETAGLLNDVSIAENGVARIDFSAELADHFISASCMSGLLFNQLEPTVRQFPSVEEVVYSFDGSISDFYAAYEGVPPPHRPGVPLEVTRMQQRIVDALVAVRQGEDYDALAQLIRRDQFSCSFSDQNEDCIALWQEQEAAGQDPIKVLFELLRDVPVKTPNAPMWVWPPAFAQDRNYLGPRTGIDEDGVWRYYQQGGG